MVLRFNRYQAEMHLRNFIRRQKWRLRPLKRLVLPLRNAKRCMVARWRTAPDIEESTRNYRGPSFVGMTEAFPPVKIPPPVHPFLPNESRIDLVSEPAQIYHLRNIDFWARYGGSVVTSDNKLLADLSPEVWGVANHPLFSQLILAARRNLPGRTAIAVTPEAPGNYYHWLIDLLPRVALLQSNSSRFDRLLLNGSGAGYETASLGALQIPSAKLAYVDSRDRFEIEEAIIPSMDHFARVIAPWKIDLLRRLGRSAPNCVIRRLYISRRHAAVRRISNESELEPILRAADFSIVELEEKSWPEQIALFAGAQVILAPHGAALANIVFAEPGTLIAEIGTRPGYRDFYLQLAASAALQYRFVEARPGRLGKAVTAVEDEDMIVDPATVRELVSGL